MIRDDEVFSIGRFTRTHGVNGELAMSFSDDVFDRTECPYLVCSIDGILVPFFLEEYRFKSDTTALIKFERIDSVEQARAFVGREVFFPKKWVGDEEPDDYTWQYFLGFAVQDVRLGTVGTVVGVDDSTLNTLFLVGRPDGTECMIPVHEDFIETIDHQGRSILFRLPDGLID